MEIVNAFMRVYVNAKFYASKSRGLAGIKLPPNIYFHLPSK